MGFKFLASPVDISNLCIVRTWASVDLSPWIPSYSTGAIVRALGGDARVDGIAFRKPGGSGSGGGTDMNPGSHAYNITGVINQRIEVYREHVSVDVFLHGWTCGGDAYLDTQPNRTPGVGSVWSDIDVSDICPDSVGVIYEIQDQNGWFYGVRKKGSTDGYDGASFHRWGVIGCDENQVFQFNPILFGGTIRQKVFITGYFTAEGAEFFTNRIDITPTIAGSWEEIDISSYLPGKRAAFIHVTSSISGKNYGLRAKGSSDEIYRGFLMQGFGVAPVDLDGKFEAKIQDSNVHMYLLGGAPSVLPQVTTDSATEVGTIKATLNGTLIEDGGEVCQCGFEWGLDTTYGYFTPTQGKTMGQTFSQVIGGLVPNTTYHFRTIATNSVGTIYGTDRTFSTVLVINKAYALAREEL